MALTDNHSAEIVSSLVSEWTEEEALAAINAATSECSEPLPPLSADDWWLRVPRWRPALHRRRRRFRTSPWTVAATALIAGLFSRLLIGNWQ